MRVRVSDETASAHATEPGGRFLPLALTKPVLAAALGIDGGAIFQVMAIEDLKLSSQALGLAFGLGLVSLPLQLWAGRMPFTLAVRNLQLFLVVAAGQSLVLAWLVGAEARGGLAQAALAVAVSAEVAISVLFVTAWQPLLSLRASVTVRQRLNAGWAAVGKAILAGALVVFASVDRAGRVVFLMALAVLALAVAFNLRHLRLARGGGPLETTVAGSGAARRTPGLVWVLASFTTINLGALPLWLVYLAHVMWPTAPLGVVGAIQTTATVAALVAWRTTHAGLGRRAIAGVLFLMAGSIELISVGMIAQTPSEQAVVIGATIIISFGMTYASLAVLEMAHRLVATTQGNAVKIFTLIDVVDSSSLQLGLLLGGLLIAHPIVIAGITPYVGYIAIMSTLAVVVTSCTSLFVKPSAAASDRVGS